MKDEAGVGSIDCQKYRWFCQEQGVNSYPTIRLYPHNSQGGYHYVYVHKEFFIILVFQCFHGQRKDRERQYSVVRVLVTRREIPMFHFDRF